MFVIEPCLESNSQHHVITPYFCIHHLIHAVKRHYFMLYEEGGTNSGKAVPQHTYRGAGGEDVWLLLMTSALDAVSGQLHAPAALYPGERTPVPIG
jgi:hypothetical protein